MKKIDLLGRRFGKLIVIAKAQSRTMGINKKKTRVFWLCKCDCGRIKEIRGSALLEGLIHSCGCMAIERIKMLNYEHGESGKTKEYRTWSHMKARCYNTSDKKYYAYGERGIEVCDKWLNSYSNFLEDMGRCPYPDWSIHRIDNDGNYTPDNCVWADNNEQANNKTTTVWIEHDGVKLSMKQWATKINVNYKWLHAQLRYKGKTLKEVMYDLS